MRSRTASDESTSCEDGGISSFLRSLLSGIPWSERASCSETLELDLPRHGVVDVHNSNGKTRIVGGDCERVTLRAVKHARAESEAAAARLLDEIVINSVEVGGTLEIDVDIPRKWNRHGSVDLEVEVPREVEVNVSSSNGKLCLQGLRCGVSAQSANGSVRLRDIVGDIDITTANAKISCDCTCGRLVARSSNGKIEIGEHSGALDAATSNGLIRATIEQLATEGVHLTTSNGRIVLELPEGPDAEVDIRVDNGVIRSELALGNENSEQAGRLRGRLGRGGTPIKLRTSNGTVSLR
jgi:hypothetical protein